MADYRIRIPIEADSSNLRSEVTRSKSALDSLKGPAGEFGAGLSSAGGPLGQLSSGISGLTSGFSLASVAGGAAALAVGAFASAATFAAKEISKTEVSLAKTEAILKATGNASGYTTKQMDEMARAMALSTLASTEGIRSAQNVLLTFKSITGPQFQKTIEIAQDMAAVFGGDATSAATKLGKALEDPATGLNSLREVGVTFTAEQKNLILSLQQTGQAAKAQAEILKVLEKQVGGAGKAEAGGLAGAVDTLGQRWGELFETWGNSIGLTKKLADGMNLISNALGATTQAMQDANSANGLFERRLELITQLAELEAKPGRGRQSQINNLRQEIKDLGDQLAATVALENAETSRQAQAMESSAAEAAAHSARLRAAAAAEAAAAKEKQDKADLIKLTEQMKLREQELVSARDKSFASYDKIRNALMGETERENELYSSRIETLTRFGERNLAFAGQANQAIELEKARHEAALTSIAKEEMDKRLMLAEIEASNRQQALGNMMTNLASLMNSRSRKMFEIGKAAAIAETAINTGRAAMGAYAALAPIPIIGPALAIAAAGAAILAGGVQIQQIKAQQFGGGGTVSVGGIGGSTGGGTSVYTPPQPTQPYGPAGEKEEGRSVNLIFNGNVNGFDVASLAEKLGEYINTSDTIFINQNSRTGLQFANAI